MSEAIRGTDRDPLGLQRALDYFRDGHLKEEIVRGSVCGIEVGDSGWMAYWGMDTDTRGRHWLNPLFRVEDRPNGATVLVERRPDGFTVDFTERFRTATTSDNYPEGLISADRLDAEQAERPSMIPVVEVFGAPSDLPLPGSFMS